jgi:hypothetical protein
LAETKGLGEGAGKRDSAGSRDDWLERSSGKGETGMPFTLLP